MAAKRKRLSLAAYAKHRGVTGEAVKKAIGASRLTEASYKLDAHGRYSFDVEKADAEWEANTDPGWAMREAAKKIDDDAAFAELKRQEILWKARYQQLQYEQRSGQLVPAQDVRLEAARLAKTLKERVLAVPDRIIEELVRMDPREARSELRSALMQALEDVK